MDYGRVVTPGVLLAVIESNVEIPEGRGAPVDYGGTLGHVDLARPVDTVAPTGKIVVTNGTYSVKHNMTYQLWVGQGCPRVETAVEEIHIARALPYLIDVMSRGKVYSVMDAAQTTPEFRSSDLFYGYSNIAGLANLERAVDKIFLWLHSNEEREVCMGMHAKMVLYSLVANAIHRSQNDGHNWYTKNTENMRTVTGKTIAVAGGDRREFKLFMLKHGHDGNHHLTDDSLVRMVDAITGRTPTMIPAGVRAQYCGKVIGGCLVHDLFRLSESATDRWPSAELGKGAAIVGLDLCSMMVAHVSSKLLLQNHGALARNVSRLGQAIGDRSIGRNGIVGLSNRLSTVIAFAHGYVTQAGLFDGSEEYAVTNHAARNKGAEGAGKALASAVLTAPVHSGAVSSAVVQGLNNLAAAIASAAEIVSEDTGVNLMEAEHVDTIEAQAGDSAIDTMTKLQILQNVAA